VEDSSRPSGPVSAHPDPVPTPPTLEQDVLDRLPYGVVVLDVRRVVSANAAAARLLCDLERPGPAAHCHELFACRATGGPCEQGCLAERAAVAPEALPEIRIDAARGGGASALWVTAAPLGGENRVVLHLRPGDSRDRRRRSEPHWLTGPDLRISAFGRTWVDSREGPIGGRWLSQRPGLLLKYLIAERNRVVHAEEIGDALWPASGRQSVNNVRHFMHSLRQKLEPDRPKGTESSFVVTVQSGYALNRRRVQIDADEFEESTSAGLTAAGSGADAEAEAHLERSVALYRGDLLADEPFAEWAYDERDRLRGLAAQGIRELVRIRLAREDFESASASLEKLAELEPYDVDVQQLLLAVLKAQGRRSEAARRYTAFKARIARDFGEEPGFDLADARLT
jgi:DNA-binding SARP family transcriptional activator